MEATTVKRIRSIFLVGAFGVLVAATGVTLKAQVPNGAGFEKVCYFYGSANQGRPAWNKDERCELPAGFRLDDGYHQPASAFRCCGGGARSNITPADIPAGIYLVVDGGYYWSVTKPIGLANRRVFTIHTYCGPGGGSNGGCNIKVTVYAKRLP